MCQPHAEHKLMGIEIYLLETGILKNRVAPTRGKQELSDGSGHPKYSTLGVIVLQKFKRYRKKSTTGKNRPRVSLFDPKRSV
jgi:hypothetical protein